MSDIEKRMQVAKQCRAVAHMATAMAAVHSDYARMFDGGVPAMDDIADIVGKRTAFFMEQLGDMINAMDAVVDEDDWVTPVFEEAQRRWPNT